jgi:hypothetical protein
MLLGHYRQKNHYDLLQLKDDFVILASCFDHFKTIAKV